MIKCFKGAYIQKVTAAELRELSSAKERRLSIQRGTEICAGCGRVSGCPLRGKGIPSKNQSLYERCIMVCESTPRGPVRLQPREERSGENGNETVNGPRSQEASHVTPHGQGFMETCYLYKSSDVFRYLVGRQFQ